MKSLNRTERIDLIESLLKTPTSKTYPVLFQNELQNLGIYRLAVNVPAYRIRNGRTRGAQLEAISKGEVTPEFFDDPDSIEVQEKQDGILGGLLTGAGLLRILKQQQQTQPLILDSEGYVVNGNRRLCAMRRLYEEKPATYPYFAYVDVVILPPCSDRDILELEGRLQVAPEGKHAYDWVAQALWIRDRKKDGWPDKEIAGVYNMSLRRISELQQMLGAGEDFLDDVSMREQYLELDKKDFAFKKIVQGRKRLLKGAPGDAALFTYISHRKIEGETEGRLYESIPLVEKHLAEIKEALLDKYGDEPSPNSENSPELDALGPRESNREQNLLNALRGKAVNIELLAIVDEVIEARNAASKKSSSRLAGRLAKLEASVALLREANSERIVLDQMKQMADLIEQARSQLDVLESELDLEETDYQ